ncbi:unnamed protein product, partial [Rotaria sp. Silwood2]
CGPPRTHRQSLSSRLLGIWPGLMIGNATSIPGNATSIPGNATSLPGNATSIPGNATSFPINATSIPGCRGLCVDPELDDLKRGQ